MAGQIVVSALERNKAENKYWGGVKWWHFYKEWSGKPSLMTRCSSKDGTRWGLFQVEGAVKSQSPESGTCLGHAGNCKGSLWLKAAEQRGEWIVDVGVAKGTALQNLSPTVKTVAFTQNEMGTVGGFWAEAWQDLIKKDQAGWITNWLAFSKQLNISLTHFAPLGGYLDQMTK